MNRAIVFLYGIISYVLFLAAFLYAIGFVGNLLVPKSINSPGGDPLATAILINALILSIFAIQHTIMARPAFKSKLSKIIPQEAERSTFVMMTSLIFGLLFWQWRPMNDIIWQVDNATGVMILQILFWIGWFIVLLSTFLIDHFDLFGVKQVTGYFLKKEFQPPQFKEIAFYKYVRHPIMLGFVIAFWASPTMTVGHLFFAVMTTGYILVGLLFEENDLKKLHGETYNQYARRVPMLIPFTKFGKSKPTEPKPNETTLAGQSE